MLTLSKALNATPPPRYLVVCGATDIWLLHGVAQTTALSSDDMRERGYFRTWRRVDGRHTPRYVETHLHYPRDLFTRHTRERVADGSLPDTFTLYV